MADEIRIVQDRRTACQVSSAKDPPSYSWYRTDLSNRIESTQKSGFMADLTVNLQDGKVLCHSYILGIASPKLAAMLSANQHEIKMPDVPLNTFMILRQIVYCETSDEIGVEKILEVTKLAHEWKFFAAENYCIKLLRVLLDETNVCSILDLALSLVYLKLKEDCTNVIRDQTDEVLKSDVFLKCNVATLEHILKQKIVHNVTELDLFHAADRWAKTHENPREALGSNLSLIRFRTITKKDFAAYVIPTKLLNDYQEGRWMWYYMAKGKGEMPAGFTNEIRKRHTTWSAEHVRDQTEKINLDWTERKYVTREELNDTRPLRISVNEDAFLIGVKPATYREGKKDGDKYMEDVEVTLKDDKGNLIATAKFRGEVTWNSYYRYDVKFLHAVPLCAAVTYELHLSHNVPDVKHYTVKQKKQVCNTKKSLRINVMEEQYSLIRCLLIAPKSV